MGSGIDYSEGYDVQSLKNSGVTFACRYIGYSAMSLPQTKIIVYSEAYDIMKLGMSLVSNWEWYADRPSINNVDFNGSPVAAFAGGVADARQAELLHISIGGPASRPIYFSVDFSTDGHDCIDYFKGVVSILGVQRVGAYGPPAALQYLKSQGLISWLWGWSAGSGLNIQQTATDQKMGNMVVDTDINLTADFGQWWIDPATLPKPVAVQYPIVVPFGNTNFDAALNGSHDLDIGAPPNMEVRSLVKGTVVNISAEDWGRVVGLQLPLPFNGKPYFSYLHLSAVNPSLKVGSSVNIGDLIGWVGGGNTQADYQGTSNPTGMNFLNSPNSSSRIQVGFALHDGPVYGGAGWVNFPPIDWNLDPSDIILAARIAAAPVSQPYPTPQPDYKLQQFNAVWLTTPFGQKWQGSGLYNARLKAFRLLKLGACTPVGDEYANDLDGTPIVNWSGQPIKWQFYSDGSHGEWNTVTNTAAIYDAFGHQVV